MIRRCALESSVPLTHRRRGRGGGGAHLGTPPSIPARYRSVMDESHLLAIHACTQSLPNGGGRLLLPGRQSDHRVCLSARPCAPLGGSPYEDSNDLLTPAAVVVFAIIEPCSRCGPSSEVGPVATDVARAMAVDRRRRGPCPSPGSHCSVQVVTETLRVARAPPLPMPHAGTQNGDRYQSLVEAHGPVRSYFLGRWWAAPEVWTMLSPAAHGLPDQGRAIRRLAGARRRRSAVCRPAYVRCGDAVATGPCHRAPGPGSALGF